jgi:coenzyme F420 biosynthesis associated uncharacterized protein
MSQFQRTLLLGASAALLWAIARRYTREAEPRLLDWQWARRIALQASGPTAPWHPALRQRLGEDYRAMLQRIEQPIADYTGTQLSLAETDVLVMDRHDWIDANLANFRQLFQPIEDAYVEGARADMFDLPGVAQSGRAVLSAEIGLLVGFLARRVLGQYDISLLGREPLTGGRLYFVEPNIQALQQQLGVPGDELRTWIALHEATHAHEFEIHPWVRSYLNTALSGYLHSVVDDMRQQARGQGGLLGSRIWTNLVRGHGLVDALMTAHQRQLVARLQALMSLAEGYSNHIMHHVGKQVLAHYDLIKARVEQRQHRRSRAERLFLRLTGLAMKMEQYALGEAFVDRVVAERSVAFINRAWDAAENLPTEAELRQPERWIQRMEQQAA